MKLSPKLAPLLLLPTLASCMNSKADPIALTPPSTAIPTSLTAIKAVPCIDDPTIFISHLDQLTNGTKEQIIKHNAAVRAVCKP